ncbi:hypothetical protein L1787_04200 [Acuticoccus sp. M5D2P5]|uniref:hypothetical protein n=1 Tax=Acuticoccus kalidii TaxID=2910977 RepID=UPI001F2A90F6|nr:hypothetical protein [Acuticoccus kalidii]MCF3932618.1 hypothetical protein [Acuticoccus kalidii]
MRLVCLALLAFAASPAAAFEPTGSIVADALLNTLERSGYRDVTVASVNRSGDTTAIETITGTGIDSGAEMTISRAEIVNGVVNADNELIADTIVYEGTRVEGENGTPPSTVGRVMIEGARYPISEATGEGLTSLFGTFERVTVDDVSARADRGDLVTIDKMMVEIEERDLETAAAGRVAIEGLGFDVSLWEEPAASQMRALGYDTVAIDLAASGRWEAATGNAVVRDVRVAMEDLGALTLTGDIDGLTASTVAALQVSMEDLPRMLQLLQSVTISNLALTYTDAGLTPRLLEQLAAANDAPVEAVTQSLVATIPDALAIINAPRFTEMVQSAARTFLDDPGTLRVSAAPPQPISIAQLMGAVMMGPQTLPTLLNLEISAQP